MADIETTLPMGQETDRALACTLGDTVVLSLTDYYFGGYEWHATAEGDGVEVVRLPDLGGVGDAAPPNRYAVRPLAVGEHSANLALARQWEEAPHKVVRITLGVTG